MGMCVIATFFGPYAPDALTSHVSVFSHNFKRFKRLTKLATSSGLICRGNVAGCLAELGGFAEGAGIGEEALRLAEAVAQPARMVIVLSYVGLFYRRQGGLQKAIPMLEQGLALA